MSLMSQERIDTSQLATENSISQTEQFDQNKHTDAKQAHHDMNREQDNQTASKEVDDWLERSRLLYGDAGICRLHDTTVMVCGVGGVGSFAVEALARSGIGTLILVDHDRVALSNINRQLVATTTSLGQTKVSIASKRVKEINPQAQVFSLAEFYAGNLAEFWSRHQSKLPPLTQVDYIVDAIDSLKAKQELIISAHRLGIKCFSALGAGNKLDPTQFVLTDLAKTHNDKLARRLRRELRKQGILHHPVVFSPELPRKTGVTTIGSTSFVPPVSGMILASAVVRDILDLK